MIDTDILLGFQEESSEILNRLTELVEKLEQPASEFPDALVREFCQKVDGIMGVAKTIGFNNPHHQGIARLSRVSELCKRIGNKVHERKLDSVLPILTAFWADSIDVMRELVHTVNDDVAGAKIEERFSIALQKRLEWLAKKMGLNVPLQSNAQLASLNKNPQLEEWLKTIGL